jgi:hypothetical protein
MRRRRPAENPADSLELLLDTICNTFGGVLFIALLVALLTHVPAVDRPQPAEIDEAHRAAKLSEQIATLEEKLSDLRKHRAVRDTLSRALGTDQLQSLLDSALEVESRVEIVSHEAVQVAAASADLLSRVVELEAEVASLEHDLQAARGDLLAVDAEWKAVKERVVSTLTMPVAGERTGMQELQFVLSGGRAYLWHEYDSAGNRLGPNLRDFVVVNETDDQIFTKPHPLRGVVLDGSAECFAELQQLTAGFRPSNWYVACIVRPDTFQHAKVFRDFAVRSAFDYRLIPADEISTHADRGGQGRGVQ